MGYCSGALFILTVLLQFRGIVSGSFCYELEYTYSYYFGYYYFYSYYTYYGYCTNGCCGYTTSRSCCTSYYYNLTYNSDDVSLIGVIVGSTVGSVVFLIVLVTVTCCVCKSINKTKVNQINVQPAATGPQGVAVVSNSVNIPMQQLPGQSQGHLPPGYHPPQAYNQQTYPPPGYPGSSNESSSIPSAWNNAPPATTQDKH